MLVAIMVDVAVLSEGAFRFNSDESMVGVWSGARLDPPRTPGPTLASSLRRVEVAAIAPPKPRLSTTVVPRPDAPAARSRLIVAADLSRASEDH